MNIEPKIGLVTVLYNGIEVLQGFFESLAKQTYENYILYVIDNSPNEIALNEAKRLAEYYNVPSEFIYNNANLGVAKGNNQGIELSLNAGCEYVLLLNNDIEFNENTIFDMVEYAINKNENIIVPKIYYYGTNKIWMAGGEILKYRGYTKHYGELEEDLGQFDNIKYIEYAPTCFMLIHKTVFNNVGKMDEKYFVYYDDTDFIFRCNARKYRVLYLPTVKLMHKVSISTGGSESDFGLYYTNRNRIYFIKKNYSLLFFFIPLSYTLITRLVKYLKYNSKQKKILVNSVVDGFRI